jgi:class 3 adenylate cyclase/predicted ATPase
LECGHKFAETPTKAGTAPTTSPQSRTEGTAERRQLTVLFCDLVGSTALSARLDPEDMREIIGAYHRCCAEQIAKAGGFVAKYMGDGVLAYFGYPQAHEDDAERAVRAGLSLTEAVSKLRSEHDAALQVRIGVATGLVVVGDLIGEGDAQERGVVGETPNLAARLQALAEPGQVVISNSTRRLTGGMFDYRDLGRVTLKGLADPVQAWQVLGSSEVESRFEAQHGAALTPLVGREEELELLMRRWRQAKAGNGSVVLISGEPGIGKSRVVQALLERLGAEPFTRLRQFCSPHHQDAALHPTITQLERAAGFRRDDTDEQRLEKLEAVLAQATNDLSEAVPLLSALLSIPIGDHYRALDLTPQKLKEKTLKALVAQVEGLAARQSVLMVVEDAHWIDPTSLELLDLIIDRVPSLRALLIVTYRPEFTPSWIGRSHVTSLILNRLPGRQRAEMVARVTEGKALPKEVADQIIERTDGIPLFIEELTKAVVESGDLADAGDHYTVKRSMVSLAIPTTLHASLLARLDRLAPVREVAQIGAALGRQFTHELITAVAPMPQKQLDDALAQLVSAELVFRRGTPPDAEYIFKHALVQDAAYSTLLRSRRQQLHARIAAVLEGQFPEIAASEPARLAQHCAEAALNEKAISYRLKAGQQGLAHSAMTEAVAQLTKGLEVLSNLPEGVTRQQYELNLRIALGVALTATQGWAAPEVGDTYARAHQLCEHLDQQQHLGSVLFGQYVHHHVRGNFGLALERGEAMWRLGEVRNDVVLIYQGRQVVGEMHALLGKFAIARANLEQSFALYDPGNNGALIALTGIGGNHTAMRLSKTVARLGYLDQARTLREMALLEARRLGHTFTLAFALLFGLYTERGECAADARLLLAEELMALSVEQGFPVYEASAAIHRGWCLCMMGRAAEGIAQFTEGLATYRSTGTVAALPYVLTLLAEAYGKALHPGEGLKHLAEAVRVIELTQEREFEAELYRVRGELLLATEDPREAEESFYAALEIARRQSAKLWELRASISLARRWRDQGKRTDARDLLAPIYGWFTEGFDTPVLKDAKALLEELG